MTSYEFEVAAKNAVIDYYKKMWNKDVKINELDFVWFAHELGYKKCTIWGKPMGMRYAEVTYNKAYDEIYLDIYLKTHNERIVDYDTKVRQNDGNMVG